MEQAHFRNTILSRLDLGALQRLSLVPVQFELGHEIEYPGNPINYLFFVEEGMASMTTTFEDGAQVEVGVFGYESIIGVSALMGTRQSLNRVYTQVEGRGFLSPVAAARVEFKRGELFKNSLSATCRRSSSNPRNPPAATRSITWSRDLPAGC